MIDDQVRPLRVQEVFGELIPFQAPRLDEGQITLGEDKLKRRLLIPMQVFNAGLVVLGNTGAAKTNLLKLLILQAAGLVKGLWCTDMYKAEMRHLRPLLRRLNRDLIILRPLQLKLNPLQADRVDPRGHLADVLGLLQRVLGLPSRAMTILRAVCHHLYEEFGIYRGRDDHWPTLCEVYERIRAAEANPAAKEALLDRLGSFIVSLTPQVMAYRLAWGPRDLTRRFIDFELSTAAEHAKSVILNYLLSSVLRSRVAEGRVNAAMDFWCIFEDAQRFFSARAEADRDITPAEELAGLIRGTGTGLCFTAQTLTGLPPGLLANLASKAMCRLGNHHDYQALGADMGMDHRQIQWAKLNLRPGVTIWQLAEGSWRLPFVANHRKLNIRPVVDDDEATESVKALDTLPTIPATEFADWSPDQVIRITTDVSALSSRMALSDAERRYLEAVVSNPGHPSSFYSKTVGISGKRTAEIRVKLVRLGYLREHRVATGQRGRNAIVLEPLDPASTALRQSAP